MPWDIVQRDRTWHYQAFKGIMNFLGFRITRYNILVGPSLSMSLSSVHHAYEGLGERSVMYCTWQP